MRKFLIPLAICLAAVGARAETTVPYVLGHQGRLVGGDDKPVTGAKKLKFALFATDDDRVKDELWSDEMDVTIGDGGFYSVLLGDKLRGATKELPAEVLANQALFLSVTIEGNELLPRQRLATTPFAIRAAIAHEAEIALKDSVGTDSIKDGVVTLAKLDSSLKNAGGTLDAATLGGFDASAFAPAAIVDTIGAPPSGSSIAGELAAVKAGVAANAAALTAGASALDATKSALLAAIDDTDMAIGAAKTSLEAAVGSAKTDTVAAVGAAKTDTIAAVTDVKTDLGTLATNLQKVLEQGRWREDCYADSNGFADAEACLKDGRWHLGAQIAANGTFEKGTLAKLREWLGQGADLRINVDNFLFDAEEVQFHDNTVGALSGQTIATGPMLWVRVSHPPLQYGSDATNYQDHMIYLPSTGAPLWGQSYYYACNGSYANHGFFEASTSCNVNRAAMNNWVGQVGKVSKWYLRF